MTKRPTPPYRRCLLLLTGLICIAASFLRLARARGLLVEAHLGGFLNGVALSIILGQADKILGLAVLESGTLPRLVEIFGKLGESHGPTLAVAAAATFLVMVIAIFNCRGYPQALVGMTLAGAAVFLFHLTGFGVKTVGPVPGGLPAFTPAWRQSRSSSSLLAEAAGLALISFSSLMLTARSFATKNGYDIHQTRISRRWAWQIWHPPCRKGSP